MVQWAEIKHVALLFILVLLTSFIGGLAAHSYAGPRLEVLVTGIMALLAIPFAAPRAQEIGALLKLPAAPRGDVLRMIGAAAGTILFLIGYFTLFTWLGVPALKITSSFLRAAWPTWSIYLAVSLLPAVVEELTFRGVIQTSLEQVFNKRDAWLIQAALFSILHFSPAIFPSHFALGLCFGFLRNKSKSLYPSMLLHATWNALVVFHELHPG
jgi:CAAX protease family protein